MKGENPLQAARIAADEMVNWLRPYCIKVEPAGSMRREKKVVGDVEVVAQPVKLWQLLYALDERLKRGEISLTYDRKWGDTYRSFMYGVVKFDLFLATQHNWGYIYWLRTGPGDSNIYVMTQMSWKQSPVRFEDGYGWEVEYQFTPSPPAPLPQGEGRKAWITRKVAKLSIPDEETLFRCLGIPVIAPQHRHRDRYQTYFEGRGHRWPTRGELRRLWVDEVREDTPIQGKLF